MSAAPLVYQFTEQLEAVVQRFRESGLTYAEAVGALEILKIKLVSDATDEEEE